MKYAVIVHESPDELAAREDPALAGGYWSAYMAYSNALRDAGVAAYGRLVALLASARATSRRPKTHSTMPSSARSHTGRPTAFRAILTHGLSPAHSGA